MPKRDSQPAQPDQAMPEQFPFHVAGGSLNPATFSVRPKPFDFGTATTSPEIAPKSSRRRRLWEIPHKFHCPVIGVCFAVDELRSLMQKVMHFPRDTTDFVLHTTAVGACEHRTKLAELLYKTLERRYKMDIQRFAVAKESEALRALWMESLRAGTDIPAALWATWTHPACDSALEQEIYGEIHMLQHQIGTGTRADLNAFNKLQDENRALNQQLIMARQEVEQIREERRRESAKLEQCISELRIELAGKDAYLARQSAALETLKESLPELRNRQTLARRASDAEARALAISAHSAQLELENNALRQRLLNGPSNVDSEEKPVKDDQAAIPGKNETLEGKSVLCVGGRASSIEAYRDIIEQHGGHFLHHDGGLEESLHRIDGVLAAADLVICQAGCISHNAYWRVKEQCKRTGKPCIFMKNTGASSLARSLAEKMNRLALREPAEIE